MAIPLILSNKFASIRLFRYKKTTLTILGLQLVSLILVIWGQSHLPPVVPLLYGRPSGEEQLVRKETLFVLPALTFIIFSICTIWANWLKDTFIDQIFIGISILTTLLSLVTVYKIIFLVGSF